MYHECELGKPSFTFCPSPDSGCVYHGYIKSFTFLTADSIDSKCTLYRMLLVTPKSKNGFTVLVITSSHSSHPLNARSAKTPRLMLKSRKTVLL